MSTVRALPLVLAAALVLAPRVARADDDTSALPFRAGLVPTAGVGIAKVTSSSPFPGFIGLTTLGAEIHAEVPPYGGFFRFQFHSSGLDGRWTAPSFALGGSYRIFGDGVDQLALLARGGLLWERWHATQGDCPIDLFVPSNCKSLTPTAPAGVITGATAPIELTEDTLGLFAGARLELPVRHFFLALDGEASGVADVSGSTPGAVLALRVAVAVGFRDARSSRDRQKNGPGPGPSPGRQRTMGRIDAPTRAE